MISLVSKNTKSVFTTDVTCCRDNHLCASQRIEPRPAHEPPESNDQPHDQYSDNHLFVQRTLKNTDAATIYADRQPIQHPRHGLHITPNTTQDRPQPKRRLTRQPTNVHTAAPHTPPHPSAPAPQQPPPTQHRPPKHPHPQHRSPPINAHHPANTDPDPKDHPSQHRSKPAATQPPPITASTSNQPKPLQVPNGPVR